MNRKATTSVSVAPCWYNGEKQRLLKIGCHALTHQPFTPNFIAEMAAAALREASPGIKVDTALHVTFSSTLEVGLYVRWRRALDGDDARTTGASAPEEAVLDRWWQEIVQGYTNLVRR